MAKSNTDVLKGILESVGKATKRELNVLSDIVTIPKADVIPTGYFDIDTKLLEIGGILKGRITEVSGAESSGKSSLMYRTAARCQQMGGNLSPTQGFVAWIDCEQCLNDEIGKLWARRHGLDTDNLIYYNDIIAEDILYQIIELCKAKVDLVVVDSVAAMLARADSIAGATDKKDLASKLSMGYSKLPGVLGNGLREINIACRVGNTAVVFINQIRDKIGVSFGDKTSTPGGRALKFFSSVRLRTDRAGEIKESNDRVGLYIKAYVQKSKISTPLRKSGVDTPGFIPFYFDGREVDEFDSILDTAIILELIDKVKNTYTFGDIKEPSKAKFITAVKNSPKAIEDIKALVAANSDRVSVKDDEMEDLGDGEE